jgi:hypothetical protein
MYPNLQTPSQLVWLYRANNPPSETSREIFTKALIQCQLSKGKPSDGGASFSLRDLLMHGEDVPPITTFEGISSRDRLCLACSEANRELIETAVK